MFYVACLFYYMTQFNNSIPKIYLPTKLENKKNKNDL